MGAPKCKPSELSQKEILDQNLKDKRIIETLRERLNEKLQKDREAPRKAALIIESWLHQKSKK